MSALDAATLTALDPRLSDAVWRLANLYFVKTKGGDVVRFAPRPGQWKVINAIYRDGLRKMIIPKARQLGISTVIALIILDLMLFKRGTQAAIVDMTQADASKKLKGKILFAFERLPDFLRDCYEVEEQSNRSFSIRLRKSGDTTRQVQAGMHARGDTYQLLHISEWGWIAFDDPARSEEIVTGALPAGEQGIVVVETTWKGGKVGHLWNYTKKALDLAAAHRTVQDFTVFFCPWWEDVDYSVEGDARQIEPECRKYLAEAEEEINQERRKAGKGEAVFAFTAGQRLWYFKVAWVLGLFRFQEYPSMLSECFRAPIEGAIYGDLIDKLRARGGTAGVVVDPEALVNTSWDRGSPLNVVTWYWQLVGDEVRLIDCDLDLDITPSERVTRMRGKGYNYGWHFFPHDVEAKDHRGRTFLGDLQEAGLENCRIVPRTDDVWVGINRVRSMFLRFTVRTPQCDEALNRLEAYRVSVLIDRGRQTDIPVHDQSSHTADALRVLAEGDLAGMVAEGWAKGCFAKEGLQALRGGVETGT